MFVVLMIPRPPISTLTYTLFPFTTLFRSIPDLGCPYDISEPVTGGRYKLPNVLIQCRRKPLPPATLCNPPCGYPKYILPEDPNFCVLDNGALSFAGSYQLSDASTSWKILVDPLDRKSTRLHSSH